MASYGDGYPGWSEWQVNRIALILMKEDDISEVRWNAEFIFPHVIEKQRLVVSQYVELLQSVDSLKDCEYYFRRICLNRISSFMFPERHSNICSYFL